MKLNQDFKEFIELLEKHKAKYLVVGSYAMAYHGYARFTQDIDFWVWVNEENSSKILNVLKDFGFGTLDINPADLQKVDNVIQLGYPPNRIDILTAIDGVEFEQAYANKANFDKAGLQICFIGLDDLIANKKATGRLKDLADIEMLKKLKNKR